MTEVEKAWVGAMVEAEGYVGFYNGRWRIGVGNTDPEIISAILRATGVGLVSIQKGTNKPIIHWSSQRYNDVINLSNQLKDYCMKVRKI